MAKRTFPLAHVYRLLEPGPVVLVTTAHKGKANIMTQSWHTMMEFEPPLVGCVISGRNHSFDALVATKECVISIPTVELAKQVVGIGNCSGKKVDKFRKFKLTPLPASQVAPPLIAECYANLECRVVDTRMVNKYNFFVLEVVKSPFQQVSYPALGLGADGCKAQRAANGYSIGKRCNAADAVPSPNPKGRLPAGALRRCGLLVENDYTAQSAPCTASRRQTARGMKPAEMDSIAWIDPAMKNPRTLHHQGKGVFMVAGDTVKLPSKMA